MSFSFNFNFNFFFVFSSTDLSPKFRQENTKGKFVKNSNFLIKFEKYQKFFLVTNPTYSRYGYPILNFGPPPAGATISPTSSPTTHNDICSPHHHYHQFISPYRYNLEQSSQRPRSITSSHTSLMTPTSPSGRIIQNFGSVSSHYFQR